MNAEQLIEEYLILQDLTEEELDEYRRMPAAQKAHMLRARKKPKSGKQKQVLRKRRKIAKRASSKQKRKRYLRRTKAFRH